jgi:hypothetical protein
MRRHTYPLNESVFEVCSDDSAYWIGMLLTDGSGRD